MITLENYKEQLWDLDKVDWYYISEFQKLSEAFIEKFHDKVDWDYISRYQKLSDSFIETHQDKVDWWFISKHQKLSEAIIEKFQDKVDWYNISEYQKLSESFIEKFQGKVSWFNISECQNHPKSDYHVVHYCSVDDRIIRISKDNLSIIEIGCFEGTQKEAIEAVSEKYSGKAKDDYINKIN
ncbi:MAG: hypothetical protein GY828_07975, partial [Candidatus Gracilibacteria bacterium]|nr:hypothetical protein [Candidatus Gracilibacteria bacterium]